MIKKRIDIVKAIKEGNYHSCFILSYSFDLAFYESIILSTLRSIGCRNNALIVDDEKYQESLDVLSGLIAHPGKLYSITPMTTRGSFHPKLILLLGDHEVTLFIGTGNVSLGGYSRNREIFFYLRADNPEDMSLRLILNAWHFIKLVAGERPGFITSQIEMAEYETPLLSEARKGGTSMADILDFQDGTKAALLTTETKESLLSKYFSLARGSKAQSLTVISPFFDSGIRTIKSLINAFQPKVVVVNVIVQPNSVNIDIKAIKALRDKRIKLFSFKSPFQPGGSGSEPYLHAKGIFLQTKNGEHLLLGSANLTFSALGDLKAPGLNTEACLYVFHPKNNQLLNVLGIEESLKDDALVSKEELSLIKWQKIDKSNSGTTMSSLLGIEYASERLIAYCGDSLKPDLSWDLELLDKNNLSLGLCKAHSVSNSSISFLCDHRLIEKAVKGRVVIGENKKTKVYIIHHIAPLSQNSPNIQTRKAWKVIESIQLGSDDLSDLIEPFEQLLFYNPQAKKHQGKPREEPEGKNGRYDTPEVDKKVPYEEFVSDASKHKLRKAHALISESSALGLLIGFLLSRIGYREKKDLEYGDTGLPETNYDEEDLMESSEGTEKIEEKEGSQAKKKASISQNQFEWQQKRLYKLADRYHEYLDDLLRENVDTRLDPIEMVKFFAAMLLLIHFAEKKISLNKKGHKETRIMFPLYSEEEYDFLYYGYEITSKFFAIAPHPIIERIALPHHLQSMPDDVASSIAIGAYVLIALLLIGEKQNYDALADIQIATVRLYINSGISKGVIDQPTIEKLFEGFHGQAGFKNQLTVRGDN